jgi:hypothetical protein
MVIFIGMLVGAFVLYNRGRHLDDFLKILLLCILVLVSFLFEYYLGRVDFLISDGYKYYANPEHWIINIDRALWGYVNYFLKYIDIGGDFFIKILNIPVLLIFLYLLRELYDRCKKQIWFVIACPSLLYLSISNLRDVLIWLMALLFIKSYFIKQPINLFFAALSAMALYSLRPFMLGTALMAIVFFELFFNEELNRRGLVTKYFSRVGFLMVVVSLGFLVYPVVKSRLDTYLYNGQWLLESGYVSIAKDKGVEDLIDSSNVPRAIVFATLRYIFTPQPDSIIRRWLDSDIPPSPYGFISEFLRLFNQVIFYLVIIYLAFNFRSALRVLASMNSTQKAMLFWFVMFLPIYSFVHFGGAHQRLKLPFQLALVIIALYSYLHKQDKKRLLA